MMMSNFDICVYIIILLGAFVAYLSKKLTAAGAITGVIVGAMIFKGAGYTGITMLAVFFVTGTTATGWQAKRKASWDKAKKESGQRTAGQVLANGGIAAISGALAWWMPQSQSLFQLMIAGALASATADTLSSELGTVYGKRFFNTISFKTDQRGLDGVVSLEGTLIGFAGAVLIAMIHNIGYGWSSIFIWIAVGGAVGNLADSIFGATLERKGLIGNNMVNFLNTTVGASVCALLSVV